MITPPLHLSPYLIFSGKNYDGESAVFFNCKNLKNATGTFHGYVGFPHCSGQTIESLHILQPENIGYAASFKYCKNLKIATGTYPGCINFTESGIQSIQNLHVQNPNEDGIYAYFNECPNLKTLEGWDLSKTSDIEPEKWKQRLNAELQYKSFLKEQNQKNFRFYKRNQIIKYNIKASLSGAFMLLKTKHAISIHRREK